MAFVGAGPVPAGFLRRAQGATLRNPLIFIDARGRPSREADLERRSGEKPFGFTSFLRRTQGATLRNLDPFRRRQAATLREIRAVVAAGPVPADFPW